MLRKVEGQCITQSSRKKVMENVVVWQLHDIHSSCLAWDTKTGCCLFLHFHPPYQIDLTLPAEWKLKDPNFDSWVD